MFKKCKKRLEKQITIDTKNSYKEMTAIHMIQRVVLSIKMYRYFDNNNYRKAMATGRPMSREVNWVVSW